VLTSSTDTDDGPRVLALERHQDVAGAQIGGVGVRVLGRLPRWMRIVRPERLPKKPGSVSDEMRKFDTVEQFERLHCLIVRMRVRPHGCGNRTASSSSVQSGHAGR
jgi:hypothetical protein